VSDPSTSVARGIAVLAVSAAVFVAACAVLRLWGPAVSAVRPICAAPIEISRGHRLELACADNLPDCDAASADRVDASPEGCRLTPGGMSARTRLAVGLPLDLNRATAVDLELLPGIGPRRAAAIVADREAHGAYGSVADLERVPGIGAATVERLRGALTVSSP